MENPHSGQRNPHEEYHEVIAVPTRVCHHIIDVLCYSIISVLTGEISICVEKFENSLVIINDSQDILLKIGISRSNNDKVTVSLIGNLPIRSNSLKKEIIRKTSEILAILAGMRDDLRTDVIELMHSVCFLENCGFYIRRRNLQSAYIFLNRARESLLNTKLSSEPINEIVLKSFRLLSIIYRLLGKESISPSLLERMFTIVSTWKNTLIFTLDGLMHKA